jgi:hypothetical protein
MITILCDFREFSAQKLAFFSKTNVMIKFLHNLALFRVKDANFFAEFFGENILKIITSVPDLSGAKEWLRRTEKALADAKKDNDFIYHERIPDEKVNSRNSFILRGSIL